MPPRPISPRKIIHLDLDAFFCAVEELHQPELVGKAFAVGGRPSERGVVSSCSYAARQMGVHSAMAMSQAVRLCPGLLIVPPNFRRYREMSEKVMAILHEQTALVEQISIDEAFLDVSDLPQSGLELAQELQGTIRDRLHLPCSVGVATNKLVAKIATDVGKAKARGPVPPSAVTVVAAGHEAEFLAPLPVSALWGIGPKTAARLAEIGVHTIGDLTLLPSAVLARQFGQAGREMSERARGIDSRSIVTEGRAQSISQEITFDRDVSEARSIAETLRTLSEAVALQLRKKSLCAGTIRIKLRWQDFTTLTRQVSLSQPTDQDGLIYQSVVQLLRSTWTDGRPIRLLGVGATKLVERAHQLSLWDTADEKERRLLDALDDLRSRFGPNAIRAGRTWKKKGQP